MGTKRISNTLLTLFLALMTLGSHASLLDTVDKAPAELSAVALISSPVNQQAAAGPPAKVDNNNYFTSAFQRPVDAVALDAPSAGDMHIDSASQPLMITGAGDENRVNSRATSVPEPSVVVLLITGLLALALSRRRMR